MICSGVIVTFGYLYKQTFRKMSLNHNVLPENILNEAEQAVNSLIPEKSKGKYNVGVFS
jgi:TRAP-type C4-dicarboxylate transport system substrate-binding protein